MKQTLWQKWQPFIISGLSGVVLVGLDFWYGFDLFPQEREKRVTFIATNLLSILALAVIVTQAIIYFRQWKAMQSGLERTDTLIEQTERHFILAERPSLGVKPPIAIDVKQNRTATVTVYLRNYGRSPAIETSIEGSRALIPRDKVPDGACPEPELGDGWDMQSISVVPIGGEIFVEPQPLDAVELKAMLADDAILFVYVKAQYKTTLGQTVPFVYEYFARFHRANTGWQICSAHNSAT